MNADWYRIERKSNKAVQLDEVDVKLLHSEGDESLELHASTCYEDSVIDCIWSRDWILKESLGMETAK